MTLQLLVTLTLSLKHDWTSYWSCIGPHFGYYREPSSTIMIVKKSFMPSVEQLFNGSSVSIVKSGRFLDGVIGNQASIEAFMKSKLCEWLRYVELIVLYCRQSASTRIHCLD